MLVFSVVVSLLAPSPHGVILLGVGRQDLAKTKCPLPSLCCCCCSPRGFGPQGISRGHKTLKPKFTTCARAIRKA